jgi:hypothetical protein
LGQGYFEMMNKLADSLYCTQYLHPTLAAYFVKGEHGSHIKHPLVFSIAHTDQLTHQSVI